MGFIDDGVIKYDRSNFTKSSPLETNSFKELERWRSILWHHNLIGEYPEEKIGFGNLSQKKNYQSLQSTDKPQFIISGTQTGKYPTLNGELYTRVLDFDLHSQKCITHGPIEASSEALTHASIYQCNPSITAVFHVHGLKMWEFMLANHYDFTPQEIPYGTFEMAMAVKECINDKSSGIFAMAGHYEGVISYGRTLEEAGDLILKVFNSL